VADLADPQARITMREHMGPDAVRWKIPRSKWRFPDASHVQMDGGFTPGALYDVVYRSSDSPVVGLGFSRDTGHGAWLRWAPARERQPARRCGRARLPLRRIAERAFSPHMLYLGLDEDEQGRMVFDAGHAARGRAGGAGSSTCASGSPR
jgi:hypothetical protein